PRFFVPLAGLFGVAVVGLGGCDFAARIHAAKNGAHEGTPVPPPATATARANAPTDPLGTRPELAAPKPFTPAMPVEFVAANGVHVWLLERPALPIVSASFVVSVGVASDPKDKPGLASLTVDMMDEGAGKRG